MKRIAYTALVGLVSVCVHAQDLPAIVQKAADSFDKLRYTATRVVEFRQPDGKRVRHTEVIIRDGARSRVEFPEGSPFAGQIIVEDGKRRLHYFPDKKEVHILPARKEEAFARMLLPSGRPGRPFKFVLAKGEVVAGIRTEAAELVDPKGNVLHRMFIDPVSGLVLKRELFDPVGTPVGSAEITKVDLSPRIDPREFRIIIRGVAYLTSIQLAQRLAKENNMLPLVLRGEGYELEHSRMVKVGEINVFAQMYVGQKGRLSLYQVDSEVLPDKLSNLAKGRFRTYAWQARGRSFVLVGDADSTELQRLAGRLTER
jgi:outer membrane lipoprotein-sorting protein